MTLECDRVGGINLAQGVCDTEVPAPVSDAAIRAILDGHNIYTRMDGIPSLRYAIAQKMEHYNGLRCDPETEILVTSGATGGFLAACMALLNPGDEVLLFEPFYGYHRNTLQCLRVQPVVVPLTAPRLATRSRPHRCCHHAPHASARLEHSRESQRKSIYPRRNGISRATRRAARSFCHHR